MAKIEALIVSHTHWDREWYRPFQEFRVRLAALTDYLLDLLDGDPDYLYFMLDGQTIVLEDYLALRPEREPELRRHIESGRLLIGPWHVLPDEFLVSGESTVRNLMLGDKLCRRFGARMPVGYTPDPFGHISQLPQILRQCDVDSAVFRRGLDDEPTELWWEAPDGSRVLAIYLRDGYGNAADLPSDVPAFVDTVKRYVGSLAPHTATPYVVLMDGVDHMWPKRELPRLIRAANEQLDDVHLVHSTLPRVVAAVGDALGVRRQAGDNGRVPEVPVVRGELRSPKRHHLLPGVLSTRMWIKQCNDAGETVLTRYAEPLAAVGRLIGGRDLRGELWQAWRYLIENHPHDSICGCSVDQVHEEMRARFAWSAQIAEMVAAEGLKVLAEQTATPPGGAVEPDADVAATMYPVRPALKVTVFNPVAGPRTDRASFLAPGLRPGQVYEIHDGDGTVLALGPGERTVRELEDRELDTASLADLLGRIETGRLRSRVVRDAELRICRPEPWRDGEGVEGELELAVAESGSPDMTAIYRFVSDVRAHLVEGRVSRWRLRVWLANSIRVEFVARAVPGFGYRTYVLAAVDDAGVQTRPTVQGQTAGATAEGSPLRMDDEAATPRPPLSAAEASGGNEAGLAIENEFFRVEAAAEDGTLTVLDKETGLKFTGLNRLVDEGDCGDEYNYCPPAHDRQVDRPAARPTIVVKDEDGCGGKIEISTHYRVPAGLTDDRSRRSAQVVNMPVVVRAWLRPGVRRVEIRTTVDNRAEDHRLRVVFPTPFRTEHALAESQFDVIARPLALPADTQAWVEQPVPTAPQCGFVAVKEDERGLLVANAGLPEYEVIPGEAGAGVVLTLLRCVGWLSRDDLACRVDHAGPGLPTPGAQCPGVHTFAYALVPFAGSMARAIHEANAFHAPLRAVAVPLTPGRLPGSLSFVDLAPAELVISAVKPADGGDGMVVRFWNTSDTPAHARLSTGFDLASAERVSLLERRMDALVVRDGRSVELPVGGKQIVSVRLRPSR